MSEEANPLDKAKEATDELLRGIGLLEIIVGGLYLYLIFLWSAGKTASLLLTTGSTWIDALLLASAAAALGVINSLPIAVVIVIYRLIGRKSRTALEEALSAWTSQPGRNPGRSDDKIDLAAFLCAVKAPTLYQIAEAARLRARAAAGFVAVGLGFTCLAFVKYGAWGFLLLSLILLLGAVGYRHYLDYLSSLRLILISVSSTPAPVTESGSTTTTVALAPPTVSVSSTTNTSPKQ